VCVPRCLDKQGHDKRRWECGHKVGFYNKVIGVEVEIPVLLGEEVQSAKYRVLPLHGSVGEPVPVPGVWGVGGWVGW